MIFSTPIFDVIIGLVSCFLAVSLAVSTLTESLLTFLNARATTLKAALVTLTNDTTLNGLLLKLYTNAASNPHATGNEKELSEVKHLPARIETPAFVKGLIDGTGLAKLDPNRLLDYFDAKFKDLPDGNFKTWLRDLVGRAQGDVRILEQEIGDWYDNAMGHVRLAYKQYAQWVNFGIALVFVVVLNIDALHLGMTIWFSDNSLPDDPKDARTALLYLDRLPIGWPPGEYWTLAHMSWSAWLFKLAGWLITAISTLFGAPFWFDTLKSITNLRGAMGKAAGGK